MNLRFFSSYASVAVQDAVRSAQDALVAFNPEGATKAQIDLMNKAFDEIGLKISAVQRQYDEAKLHLDEAVKLNNTRMTAAENLQNQIAAGDASKQASLETLVGIIEKAQPDLDAIRKQEASIRSYLNDLQAKYEDAANKLKAARNQLDQAHRDMERAQMDAARAKDRAEAAEIAAGIRSGSDTLNVALDAMNRKARAAQDAADAADRKAAILTPQDHEKDDPNIAAALAEASGAPTAPSNVADRLAALKAKAA